MSYSGVHYDPCASHGHVESYFLKANDPVGRRALWLKATIFASDRDPSRAVAEAWAVAFDRDEGHVAVKSWVPYENARFARDRFDVEVDGCRLHAEGARGRVATGGRSIEWELSLTPSTPLLHLPRFLYRGSVPSLKLATLLLDSRASGSLAVCGEPWTLDGWHAMVGHNWGRGHSSRYAWGHCNAWDGSDDGELVFEAASGRLPMGPIAPTTSGIFVRYRDVVYRLDGVRQLLGGHADMTFRRWRVGGKSARIAVEAELWGKTDDFVGLYYKNPTGTLTYCLNSKIAHAEVSVRPLSGGDRGTERVYRSRAAALEIGTLDPRHGVKMYV